MREVGELALQGRGGEPIDWRRTLASHGVATLPPNRIDSDAWTWHTTLPSDDGGSESLLISELRPGVATVLAERDHNSADAQRLLATCRQMLRLDDDLSRFYLVAAADPDIAWATTGAGRMLRSPTVFEDVIKTICTTNCSWSGTERMVAALVRHLGSPDGCGQHAFPSPGAMTKADPEFYREVARTGYRGPICRRWRARFSRAGWTWRTSLTPASPTPRPRRDSSPCLASDPTPPLTSC
jgi:hypothetical protein